MLIVTLNINTFWCWYIVFGFKGIQNASPETIAANLTKVYRKKIMMTVDEIYKQIEQKLIDHFESDKWKEAVLRIMRVEKTVGFKDEYKDKYDAIQDI